MTSSHHRAPSVVPIGGQPFVSPYAQAMSAYQHDPSLSASSSSASGSSNMGLGITIGSHGSSSSSSSAGSDRSDGSPTSLNFKHVSHPEYGTSPSSPSSSSSASSADAYTSISPSASQPSPLAARHEAAMRYATAMHSHTTAMWQEERDNIERARLGHNSSAHEAPEEKWSVSGLLRGRSSRRKGGDKKVSRKA